MFFWYHFWVSPWFRALFLGMFAMLIFHKVRVHMVLARKWSHRNRRGAAAMVGLAAGGQFLVLGVLLRMFGLEQSLLVMNRDLVLLPAWGSAPPGTCTLMGLSPELPLGFLLAAGMVFSVSLVLFLYNRKGPAHSSLRGPG